VECESSCEAGMCRACELRYLEGDPIHGDLVLGEDERRDSLLICCAKVGRAPLVLDI